MKLYVWENVLVDYTDGIMFALANSAEEARAVILEECSLQSVVTDLKSEPRAVDKPEGFIIWGGG